MAVQITQGGDLNTRRARRLEHGLPGPGFDALLVNEDERHEIDR
jgi:hypothetical protein